MNCQFLRILQIILYLIPRSFWHRLHPQLTETSQCSSLPQLCNDITLYFICHTILIFPDILQHRENSYMGDYINKIECLVYFNPMKVLWWNLDQRRIKVSQNRWRKKGLVNIILGEVGFKYFLSPMDFLMDFVWITPFKFC